MPSLCRRTSSLERGAGLRNACAGVGRPRVGLRCARQRTKLDDPLWIAFRAFRSFFTQACSRCATVHSREHTRRSIMASPAKREESPLHAAVLHGRCDEVTALLAEGADANTLSSDRIPVLVIACVIGNTKIARALLAAKGRAPRARAPAPSRVPPTVHERWIVQPQARRSPGRARALPCGGGAAPPSPDADAQQLHGAAARRARRRCESLRGVCFF